MSTDIRISLYKRTHVFQYGCLNDASFEACPTVVQPADGPVIAWAQSPVPEVQDLQGLLWTNTVHFTEISNSAIPQRHQHFAVKRDVKAVETRDIVRKNKPPGACKLPCSRNLQEGHNFEI